MAKGLQPQTIHSCTAQDVYIVYECWVEHGAFPELAPATSPTVQADSQHTTIALKTPRLSCCPAHLGPRTPACAAPKYALALSGSTT